MANVVGYEELRVESSPVGPTSALVRGGAASAVFYVDDEAPGPVRWRPASSTQISNANSLGFPLKPGAWIAVAGEGNIRNSTFQRDGAVGGSVRVHVLYFDRVDVIAADFAGITPKTIIERGRAQEAKLDQILIELRRHTDALQEVVNRELVEATR